MKRRKITIVGAGSTGGACAQWAVARGLGDLVLVDTAEGLAQGKALDLFESCPLTGHEASIVGSTDFEPSTGSDVIVVTAGVARKAGMSRDEFIKTNVEIVARVTEQAVAVSPSAVVIVVTNPIGGTVFAAHEASGFPPSRVIGQGGVLDAAVYRAFIAEEAGISVDDVSALVLGGHGDSMVPLKRYTTVAGIPVTQVLAPGKLEDIVTRTRNNAAELLNLLKTGGSIFTPAAAAIRVAEAVLKDEKRVLSCTAYCKGSYGVGGMFVGVPCVIGEGGVQRVIEIELDAREKDMFTASAARMKELCEITKKHLAK